MREITLWDEDKLNSSWHEREGSFMVLSTNTFSFLSNMVAYTHYRASPFLILNLKGLHGMCLLFIKLITTIVKFKRRVVVGRYVHKLSVSRATSKRDYVVERRCMHPFSFLSKPRCYYLEHAVALLK
ncbi:hypothetical protein BC629DRAFT_1549886 [Irpex lacteus]|nr:hypothetical protein BC629DRAFT_1549886 [Irpex lacteus]